VQPDFGTRTQGKSVNDSWHFVLFVFKATVDYLFTSATTNPDDFLVDEFERVPNLAGTNTLMHTKRFAILI
jgi:hypothetical protein